jgi:hypothetical protein
VLIFGCKEGFSPGGKFIALCHHNGTWIPNPNDHICTGINRIIIIILIMHAFLSVGRAQFDLIIIIAIPSSSAAVLIVIFFIVGCICGRIRKRVPNQETSINNIINSPRHSSPVYETIMPPISWSQDEILKQDIQLKSNMVYGQCELAPSAEQVPEYEAMRSLGYSDV